MLFRSVASIILDLRVFIGDKPNDDALIRLINLGIEAVYAEKDNWYFARKKETYTTVASTPEYSLPLDFKAIDNKAVFQVTATTVVPLTYMDYNAFQPMYAFATGVDNYSNFTIDEDANELLIGPKPLTGGDSIEMWYYSSPTAVFEYGDEIEIPTARPIVFWVASKLEAAKKNEIQSKLYDQEFARAIVSLSNKRLNEPRVFKIG